MTSVTEVANLALQEIGQTPITDINEGTDSANQVLLVYDDVVTEVTQSKFWSQVKTRVELARLPDPPLYGFNFQFQLPADNLNVLSINERPAQEFTYNIEDGKLLFNQDEVKITYIRKQDNPTLWGYGLKRAIVLRLAAGVSYGVVRNAELTQQLYNLYRSFSREASGRDSNQGSRKHYNATRTLRIR